MSDPIGLPEPKVLAIALDALADLGLRRKLTLTEHITMTGASYETRADVGNDLPEQRDALLAAMRNVHVVDWRGESGTLYREHHGTIGQWPIVIQEVTGYEVPQTVDERAPESDGDGRVVATVDEHGAAAPAPAIGRVALDASGELPVVPDPRGRPRPYVLEAMRQNAAGSHYEESA